MNLQHGHRANTICVAAAAIGSRVPIGWLAFLRSGGSPPSTGTASMITVIPFLFVAIVTISRSLCDPNADGMSSGVAECRACGHLRRSPADQCPECGMHPRRLRRHLSRWAAAQARRGPAQWAYPFVPMSLIFALDPDVGMPLATVVWAMYATVTGLRTDAFFRRLFAVGARSRPHPPADGSSN
jgi:hypothetical protein